MSRLSIALILLFGIALCFAMATASIAEDEQKVTLDQCPKAVQDTLNKEAAGGTIQEIEKETEDGKVVYEAEITKDGKTYEVEVAEDGTLLESEVDDDDSGEDDED